MGSRWFKIAVQDESPVFMGRFKMVQDELIFY